MRSFVHRFVKQIRINWPLIPAAIYLLGFLVVVLTYLLGMSFSIAGSNGEPVFPTLESVRAVFAMGEFREALNNTIWFVVVGTPTELIFGLALALLVYNSFRFRGILRAILIIPLAIPALVTATLLFILFDYPGGHVNHFLLGKYSIFPAFIDMPIDWRGSKIFSLGISLLGKAWRDMPISMLILLSGLNSIDPELIDAAKNMGANIWQRLRRLIFPLIFPSISAVVLLRSIEMWKEFIFPFILAGQYDLLGTLIESLYNDWGRVHEASVIALVLVICIIFGAVILFALLEMLRRLLIRY